MAILAGIFALILIAVGALSYDAKRQARKLREAGEQGKEGGGG